MLIICPNCAASYQVSAASIGPEGRSVRCVRCRTVWKELLPGEAPALTFTEPPAPEAASDETVAAFRAELAQGTEDGAESGADTADEPAGEDLSQSPLPALEVEAGPSLEEMLASDDSDARAGDAGDGAGEQLAELPAADAPSLAPETPSFVPLQRPDAGGDVETTASRRTRIGPRKQSKLPKGPLPVIIVALMLVIAGLIGWRGPIVRQAPQMASLYRAIGLPVNLRGLAFKEIQVARDLHDGVPVLVVEGAITSTAAAPVEVPRLRFAMQNEAGSEVYSWTAVPTQSVLAPGETLAFRSRLASPPGDGRTVVVRFFNRRDTVAGLR